MRLIVGMSGSTGLIYGIRLLQLLKPMPDVQTFLIMSRVAKMNAAIETDWSLKDIENLADEVYSDKDVAAAISSGSFKTDGMVVVPCSMKTLSGIAHSYAETLIVRAADVVLKERRQLVIVPRETPLSLAHIDNMRCVTEAGAVVLPASPGWYYEVKSPLDLVDFVVARICDQLGVEHTLCKRWGEE